MSNQLKKRIKIAIVIGDAIFRNGMESFIGKHENMDVCFAADNMAALKEYSHTHKDLDICIADLHLHKEETAACIEQFRHSHPQLKFVLFSNAAHPYNVKKAMAIGCSGIIDKYASANTIIKALLSVHYTGSFYEENLSGKLPQNSNNELITDLELKVLKYLCTSKSTKEISKELNISISILSAYKNLLYKKLNVASREMLIKCAYTLGLIER